MTIEQIKDKLKSKEYDFLRTDKNLGDNIIILTLGGSHAYGMDKEGSDLDVRGIALNSKSDILLGTDFEQVVDVDTDTTMYSFNKMIQLLTSSNPNTIEQLGCLPEHYLHLSDMGRELLDNRKMFLSKICIHTFGGYSSSQLRRMENKAARLVGQAENEAYILKSINNARYEFKNRYYPHNESDLKLYIDKAVQEGYDSEIFMDVNLKHYPLRDWAGMWNEMKAIVSSYSKFGKRNEKAVAHDKLGKHMAHLIRLYMMCIDILEKEEIIHSLQNNGYEAFLVGGCVRDSILKRPIHDYDITTSATPDEMMKVFKDKRIIETGLQHGTITIVINGEPYEVTTYRIDGNYSDNRRPDKVTFTKSLEEDLKRRDFTINAMAYNDEVGLVDPFNGMEDIKYHKIQCVGKSEDRFAEDALRILRAIRFASQLDFVLEPNTDYVLHKMYQNLENISVERINSEFCKIAASSDFCVQMVLYSDVLSLFIPEIKDMFEFPQNNPYHIYDVWGHTIHAVEAYFCDCEEDLNPIDLITSLAVFFHDIGKPHCYQDGEDDIRHFKGHGRVSADMTDKIMKRLRFDNDTREKVVELVYYHDATFEMGKKYVKRWLNKIGEEQFRRLLNVRRADIKAQADMDQETRLQKIDNIEYILEEVLQDDECFSLKDLAVNGKDVMDTMLIESGKEVGYWLNEILTRVIDGRLKNDRENLIYWMTGITDGWIKY